MNNALAGGAAAMSASHAGQTAAGGAGIAGRVDRAMPLVFRSVALFAILYQFRLLAGGLADTAFYVAALLGAFAAALFLARRSMPFSGAGNVAARGLAARALRGALGGALAGKAAPLIALAAIALAPWAARALVAMPRLLFPGRTDSIAIALDALLLNFDRNNFVALLPFYWAAATTWLSLRSRLFLRGAVIADAVLLIAIFAFAPIEDIGMYRWPIVLIAVVASIIFLQSLALLFSMPQGTRLQKSEKITAAIVLLLLVVFGGIVFLRHAQARAVHRGGGLLEPRGLFSFDFSQMLTLNPEISMSDELVLIVRTYPPIPDPPRVNPHIPNPPFMDPPRQSALIRRAVMSGFDRRQGFFRIDELDERTHPQRVPNRPTEFPAPDARALRRVSQEFFLVNFEATALIGMKQPVEVIPFETWDASSFRAAYAVESMAVDFGLADFIRRGGGEAWPTLEDFGLSEREFAMYTYYGDNERLRAFAREVTAGRESFPEKILAIYTHLKFGDFRYSLSPGIAPDGDQLAWFLFYTQRGYCTYFAFAMTLMLRSLGIPARVAAGFFVDPAASAFNYYAVRADMAHAWVEALIPGYGWVEFDPTTGILAEDEDFAFSMGVDPDLFERLMREILENREQLRVRMGPDADGARTGAGSFVQASVEALRRAALPLALLMLSITFALIRCGHLLLSRLRGKERRKAASLWNHARRRLRLAGLGCPSALTESEWAQRVNSAVPGAYDMYLAVAAARFAPEYGAGDFAAMQGAYRRFSLSCKKAVSPWRRFLAWALPPLALALPARVSAGKTGLAVLLLLAFAAVHDGSAYDVEAPPPMDANELFVAALAAERVEHWERAVSLYQEGIRRFPSDIRFPRNLGSLYYEQALYNLAWDTFRVAERINPYDSRLLQRMASAATFLNWDHVAVAYLERVLEIDPDSRSAITSLAWMYYKVHRLADSERLLLDAIERFGVDAELAMTLGTINASMFRLEEGRYWYRRSIGSSDWRHIWAVAHYNLALLESRFFYYDFALDRANDSIDAQRRATGFLARGDLLMRQLELQSAAADFVTAQEVSARDTFPSPLPRLSLARTHLAAGRLVEARLYAHATLRVSDHAWMAHFGINPDRYLREVHELLHNIYSGLALAERFAPSRTPFQAIASMFRSASYRFRAEVHGKFSQKYSLASGSAFDKITREGGGFADIHSWEPGGENQGAPPIDRYLQFFNAFRSYPRRAALYLRKARSFETALIPASVYSYDLEEGRLFGDLRRTAAALEGFDPTWQRDLIAMAYREFALGSRTRRERQAFAEELFALNRGALLQSGIALPAQIDARFLAEEGRGDGRIRNARRHERTMRRALEKAGFARHAPAPGGGGPRFRLDIEARYAPERFDVSVSLIDNETGEIVFSRGAAPAARIDLPSASRADIYAFAADLSRAVFRVD